MVPGEMMARQNAQGKWEVYSIRPAGSGSTIPPNGYYPLDRCDMGHHPFAAAEWWNKVTPGSQTAGKFLPRLSSGGPGVEVRAWMTDQKNYQLQLDSHNRSAGTTITKKNGYFWVPPGTPD